MEQNGVIYRKSIRENYVSVDTVNFATCIRLILNAFRGLNDYVDSTLGKIPEGWEVTPASECLHINPKVTVPRVGDKPYAPMGSLSTNSMLISDIESRSGNSGSKFQNGDTLFARINPTLACKMGRLASYNSCRITKQ
jgi:hypothetical protein